MMILRKDPEIGKSSRKDDCKVTGNKRAQGKMTAR